MILRERFFKTDQCFSWYIELGYNYFRKNSYLSFSLQIRPFQSLSHRPNLGGGAAIRDKGLSNIFKPKNIFLLVVNLKRSN